MENEAEEIDTQSTAVPKSSKASKRKASKKSTAKPAKVSSISLGTPSDEGFGDDMDSLKDLISKMESAESESNNEQKAETAENLEDLSQYFGNVNESQEKSEENVEIESKGNEEIDSENLTAAISKILKDTLDMTGGLIGLELLLDELKDAGFPNLKKIEIMEIMDELKEQQVILDEINFSGTSFYTYNDSLNIDAEMRTVMKQFAIHGPMTLEDISDAIDWDQAQTTRY